MRSLNQVALNAVSNAGTVNSNAIYTDQVNQLSVHTVFTDGAAAGTVKVQASNDHTSFGNIPADFTPTNWVDIPTASQTIAAGAQSLITIPNLCYQWVRIVWTSTGGAGTLTSTVKTFGV